MSQLAIDLCIAMLLGCALSLAYLLEALLALFTPCSCATCVAADARVR